MKVMISQPMNGVPDEEVKKTIDYITKKANQMGIEIVNSFDTTEIKDSKYPGVYYLGRTLINHLHNIDAVYFTGDWRNARGCRIEFAVCQEYGIKILPERFFDDQIPAPIMNKPLSKEEYERAMSHINKFNTPGQQFDSMNENHIPRID